MRLHAELTDEDIDYLKVVFPDSYNTFIRVLLDQTCDHIWLVTMMREQFAVSGAMRWLESQEAWIEKGVDYRVGCL